MRRVGLALAGMASLLWGASAACGGRATTLDTGIGLGPGGTAGNGGAAAGRGGAGGGSGGTGRGGSSASGSGGSAASGGAAGSTASGGGGAAGSAGAMSIAGAPGAGGSPGGDGSCESPQRIAGEEASFGGFIPRSPSVFDGCVGEGPERAFVWTSPAAGQYFFDTVGSGFDTVLYAATSLSCDGSGPVPDGACSDDFDGNESLVSVDVAAGQDVFIVVDSYNSSGGDYLLSVHGAGQCPLVSLGSELGRPLFNSPEFIRLVHALEPGGLDECGGRAVGFTLAWQAPAAGAYVFDTQGSTFDTMLAVREACDGPALGCDDSRVNGGTARVVSTLELGQQVVIEFGVPSRSSPTRFGELFFSVSPL